MEENRLSKFSPIGELFKWQNIDAQAVIKHLSEQVAKLSVDVAIKDAQIEALQKQAAEQSNSTEKFYREENGRGYISGKSSRI
ncbi:hypothetical protein [Terribacillus saccharophilus]|uniref:hypothetical protein n=1 Tax=Terribacillus saccharophilus TaxID=361277 RepID=UPI003981D7EC